MSVLRRHVPRLFTLLLIWGSLAAVVVGTWRLEERLLQTDLSQAADDAQITLERTLTLQTNAVESVRSLFLASQEVTEQEFNIFAMDAFEASGGLETLQWVDRNNIVRFVYPLTSTNLRAVGFDNNKYPNRLEPILRGKQTRGPIVTEPIQLVQGFPGIIVYVPIYRGDDYLGSAVGVLRLEKLLRDVVNRLPTPSFETQITTPKSMISVDGKRIFSLDGKEITTLSGEGSGSATMATFATPGNYTKTVNIRVVDTTWTMRVKPTEARRWEAFQRTLGSASFGFIAALTMHAILWRMRWQRSRLEEVVKREGEFVSLVAHQLRTPISQMNWLLEAYADEKKLPAAKRREFLDDLITINRRNARLIDNLLNVSRIERGILTLELKELLMKDVVKEAAAFLAAEAGTERVHIEDQTPPDLVILADQLKAVEAVKNVIDNAVVHTRPGTKVTIRAKPEAGGVVLSVSDTGPGIPPEIQKRLFLKSGAFTTKGETGKGTGLGLYLTKSFMQLMGGDVTFKTSPKGTTFFLKFRKNA